MHALLWISQPYIIIKKSHNGYLASRVFLIEGDSARRIYKGSIAPASYHYLYLYFHEIYIFC